MQIKYTIGVDVKEGDFLKIRDGRLYPCRRNDKWSFIATRDYAEGEEADIEVDVESEEAKA